MISQSVPFCGNFFIINCELENSVSAKWNVHTVVKLSCTQAAWLDTVNNFTSVNEEHDLVKFAPHDQLNRLWTLQFYKHFRHVNYSSSKISYTIAHCMHAPVQCFQNALAYFVMVVY
jgi:hypothetical protein